MPAPIERLAGGVVWLCVFDTVKPVAGSAVATQSLDCRGRGQNFAGHPPSWLSGRSAVAAASISSSFFPQNHQVRIRHAALTAIDEEARTICSVCSLSRSSSSLIIAILPSTVDCHGWSLILIAAEHSRRTLGLLRRTEYCLSWL